MTYFLMIIRICPKTPRRGNEHLAQGNALGVGVPTIAL